MKISKIKVENYTIALSSKSTCNAYVIKNGIKL